MVCFSKLSLALWETKTVVLYIGEQVAILQFAEGKEILDSATKKHRKVWFASSC